MRTMDTTEASGVLMQALEPYRARSYRELVELTGSTLVGETMSAGGVRYQTEILVMWDSHPQGDIRVIGQVDDGGWRVFLPLVDGFVRTCGGK